MVKYYTKPIMGDRNHVMKFAETGGVTFEAFPYSSYVGRAGMTSAIVTVSWHGISVSLYDCFTNGETEKFAFQKFTDSDEAFEYAAKQIRKREVEKFL